MISCSSDSLHTRQTMNRSIVLVIFFTQIVFSFAVSDNCTTFDEKPKPEYYPLRHCQRANGTIIGFRNIKSLYECMMFARERGALAFNYAPEGRVKRNRFESLNQTLNGTFMINSTKHRKQKKIHTISEEYYNCQALACPEYGNFSTMLNDTRFDYYSLYTKPPPRYNSTCIPTIGMFIFFDHPENYSTAFTSCKNVGGILADIVSEQQTNSLSEFIRDNINSTLGNESYIGMNESLKNFFYTSKDAPLRCFLYRAWAPGHPSERRLEPSCVALSRDNSWKVFSCRKRLTFICELLPSGPNPFVSVRKKCSIHRPNNRFMRWKETETVMADEVHS